VIALPGLAFAIILEGVLPGGFFTEMSQNIAHTSASPMNLYLKLLNGCEISDATFESLVPGIPEGRC
jgi:hypothetical protein